MKTTDGKNLLEIFTVFLFLILNLASLAFLSVIVYNILCYADLEKYNLTFIVILVTSIATSAFFLIRIYIENQLGIKEKEMLKEYEDKIKELVTNEKLENAFIKSDHTINKTLTELINHTNNSIQDNKKQVIDLIQKQQIQLNEITNWINKK